MNRPHEIKAYCPYCKKHTIQVIEKVKKRKASELKAGQRRFRKVMAGYRGFPRPKPKGREKATKRVYLLYRCKECNHAIQPPAIRAKRFGFKGETG